MNTHDTIQPVILPGESEFAVTQPDGSQLRGYFHDSGSGPVGVFVHGFRSHCNGEKSLAFARHALGQGRSWLRFDMRGHGLSDGALEDQVVSFALADLQAVLNLTGDRKLIMLGSSMGGWMSLLAAMREPQRVIGMVLIAPAFNFVQKNFATLPAEVLATWQRDRHMYFPDAYGNEPYAVDFAIIEDALQYDVLSIPVDLDIPLHIIHGEADIVIPLSNTHEFIDNVQSDRLVLETVPDGDHRLTDHIPLITSHLDRVWQEARS